MSHVDEGTLHAYLDGELAPVERERVDTHLKGCPACQARLAEERAIIERASRLLGMATPPERAMPPLHQLRQPRLAWRLRRPLAWAATLILAVGLGWYARGTIQERAAPQREAETDKSVAAAAPATPTPAPAAMVDSDRLVLAPQASLSIRRALRRADTSARDRDAQRQLADLRAAASAASNALQARDSATVATGAVTIAKDSARQIADAAAQLPPVASRVKVRGLPAAAPAATPEPSVTIDGSLANGSLYGGAARQRATPIMSTTWPIIARQPARDALGVEPVVIPGFAVRAYRRNPATQEIAVEQVTDAGTTISLIERRVDTLSDELRRTDSPAAYAPRWTAKAVNERLARFVGSLRIEIEGPLTPDSLSSLLELAR